MALKDPQGAAPCFWEWREQCSCNSSESSESLPQRGAEGTGLLQQGGNLGCAIAACLKMVNNWCLDPTHV